MRCRNDQLTIRGVAGVWLLSHTGESVWTLRCMGSLPLPQTLPQFGSLRLSGHRSGSGMRWAAVCVTVPIWAAISVSVFTQLDHARTSSTCNPHHRFTILRTGSSVGWPRSNHLARPRSGRTHPLPKNKVQQWRPPGQDIGMARWVIVTVLSQRMGHRRERMLAVWVGYCSPGNRQPPDPRSSLPYGQAGVFGAVPVPVAVAVACIKCTHIRHHPAGRVMRSD